MVVAALTVQLTALATFENVLLAFEPISLTVPITIIKITASMTAYSAMSCPRSSLQNWERIDADSLSSRLTFIK